MTREEKQKAIDALKTSAPVMAVTQEEFNDYIQTLNKIMDWLEQQPCEDAISKQEVCKIINDIRDCISVEGYWAILERLKKLPPVNPQEPKTGHWRHYEGMLICSECGTEFYDDIMEYCCDDVPKYCPNCGQPKMQEVEE